MSIIDLVTAIRKYEISNSNLSNQILFNTMMWCIDHNLDLEKRLNYDLGNGYSIVLSRAFLYDTTPEGFHYWQQIENYLKATYP